MPSKVNGFSSLDSQRGVYLDYRAFLREGIHDIQSPEPSTAPERVLNKIHCPYLVGPCRLRRQDPSY